MSLLDDYKKKYPQQSNTLEDYKKTYKDPTPYQPLQPTGVATPEPEPVVNKPTLLNRIDNLTARPDESTLGTNARRNTMKYLPSSIAENLPFGIGEIVKQSRDEPEVVSSVKFDDVLQGIVDTSKGTFTSLIGTGASLAGTPLKFNVPGLGEVTNLQYNAAQRIANGESATKVIIEEGIVNNIFGTLMLVGLANEVVGPRPTTIKSVDFKGETPNGLKVKEQPKSFRLYEQPTGTASLSPEFVEKMATERGVNLGPKYNPDLPTYFKVTGKANGIIRGEVVQVKPSYLETFLKKFGTDIGKVPDNMIVPIMSKEINTKQLTGTKVSVVPESTIIPPSKTEAVAKVEQLIPQIKNAPADEHLVATVKGLAEQTGDQAVIKKVDEAIAASEEVAKKVEETNKGLQQYAEQAIQTPEKELVQPMYEPYKPARAVPVDRVYQNTPVSKFIIGEYEGKPFTSDAYILEFNSNVQPPKKVTNITQKEDAPKIDQLIPKPEELVKAKVVEVLNNGALDFVKLDADGKSVILNRKYFDYFNKKYPNSVFMVSEANKPVVVMKGGEKVGLIMPMNGINGKTTTTWSRPPVQQPTITSAKKNTATTQKEVPKEKTYNITPSEKKVLDVQLVGKLKGGDVLKISGENYTYEKEIDVTGDVLEKLNAEKISDNWLNINREKGKIIIDDIYGDVIYTLDLSKVQKPRVKSAVDEVKTGIPKLAELKAMTKSELIKLANENGIAIKASGDKSSIIYQISIAKSKASDETVRAPSTSGGNLASKGAGKIGNFEPIEKPKEGTKPFKLHQEVLDLAHKYNPNGSIMESKNMPHGAAGVRWGDTGNISTQGLNDLAIMSHELSHTIDNENGITDQLMKITGTASNGNPIYDSATKDTRSQLTKVYTEFYAGGKDTHKLKTRMREGYATLLQKYVEMPQTMTAQFPDLIKDFLQPGGQFYNPTAAAMVADSHRIASDYHNLSGIDKMGARVTDTLTETGKKSFMNAIQQVNYEMVDNIAPFEVLDQKLADTARLIGYTSNLIQQNVKGSWKYGTKKADNSYWGLRKGEPVKLQDYNWNSVISAVGKENQLKFGYWLVGRATHFDYIELAKLKSDYDNLKGALTIMKMNKEPIPASMLDEFVKLDKDYKDFKKVIEKDGITQEEATQAYNEGKEIFAKPAEMFDTLNREKINAMMDVGLLSREQGKEYLSKEGYASRKRDIYNEIIGDSQVPNQIRVGANKVSSMIRRRGSSKAIINPLVSAIHDDMEVSKKVIRQMVANEIGNIGLDTAFPDLIQRVDLKRNVDSKTGAITYPQEKQENVIMARKDGQRIPFEVDNLIAQVYNEIATPTNIKTIGRMIQFFGRTFTKGTTGIISTFVFKNPLIDSITSLAQTQTNYIPVYDQIKNIQKIISNQNSPEAQYAREYMVFVGNNQTSMGIYDLTPEQQLNYIKGEVTGLEGFAKKLEDGVNILTIPTQMTEIATRITEYTNARLQGKSFARALEMAGEVSAPFHHKPRFGNNTGLKLWVGNLPYTRSAIQVTAKAARTIADSKTRKRYLAVWALVIAAYVAAQEASMSDATDEQKALYEGLYGKQLASGIYFPNSDGKTLNVVPVSETMGWLGAMINMELMEMAGKTNYSAGDYAQAGTAWVPRQINPFNGIWPMVASSIPKPLDTIVGLATNTKFYPAKLPIVSQSLERLPAGMQYNEKTSPVAKWLGKEFDLSPQRMDFLVSGVLGRAGSMVMGKASYWNFLSSFQQENYFTSSRLVQDFWETKQENDKDYAGYKKDPMSNTKAENAKIVNTNNQLKGIYKLINSYSDTNLEKNPELAEKQRKQILNEIKKLNK